MADPKKSLYARLASRFAHLALGAKEEEDEEERAEEDEEREEAREEDHEEEDPERRGKKGKKAKRSNKESPTSEEDEDEDDDEDEDEERKNDRKAAAEARAAERSRWVAVMSSKAASGRIPLACSLLADTGMSAEKICGALGASPTEARHGLAARMAGVARPDVGSGPAARAPDPNSSEGRVAAFKAAVTKATGREFEAA